MPSLTIGIASYNNSKNLIQTINTVKNALSKTEVTNYQIVVIDDCSKDDTEQKFKEQFINDKNLIFYKNEKNIGFANSILKSAKLGNGFMFKIMHSGNIESEEDLAKYFEDFESYKCIISSIVDKRNILRKILSTVCTKIIRFITGQKVKYYQSLMMILKIITYY